LILIFYYYIDSGLKGGENDVKINFYDVINIIYR